MMMSEFLGFKSYSLPYWCPFCKETYEEDDKVYHLDCCDEEEEEEKGFSDLVRIKSDLFWMNTCLGYDVKGKLIRTDKPRKKPKEFFEMEFGSKSKRTQPKENK
mgnify:CR=1 FL=1